jgi:hypothetical protein
MKLGLQRKANRIAVNDPPKAAGVRFDNHQSDGRGKIDGKSVDTRSREAPQFRTRRAGASKLMAAGCCALLHRIAFRRALQSNGSGEVPRSEEGRKVPIGYR